MTTSRTSEHSVALKPYSTKELTELYGISRRTFNTWLTPFKEEVGTKFGRYYTVAQVQLIFKKLGWPGG